MALASTTPLQQASKAHADEAASLLGEGLITPAMLSAAVKTAFEQGAVWNQGPSAFLDEALNSGDGSYRP